MQPSICVLGSLNIDLVVSMERFHCPGETVNGFDFQTFTGGKGGNQAVAAARLGARVEMVGCLGDDAHGALYRAELERLGIGTAHLSTIEGVASGVALIEVDPAGENRIVVVAGANEALTPDRVTEAMPAIQRCGALLLQLETPIESVTHAAALAKHAGATVVLDPAPVSGVGSVPDALLMICDYITPNEHELSRLTGMPAETEQQAVEACARLIRRGARAVVNKRGAKGALLVTAQGAQALPAFPVEVADTTAAGDTFNAALAVGLMMDMEAPDAVRFANAAAALSTTGKGAQGAMPDIESVLALCMM